MRNSLRWLASVVLTVTLCLIVYIPNVSAASYFAPSDLTIPAGAEAIVYGTSGAGRDLMAYRFGTGKNVMVVGFAIHGYEDNWAKDGGALVYTAGQLMNRLSQNSSLISDYGWSIYVLPCMNPDGLIDGYTNNGPGRCTTTYLTSNGSLFTGRGVDLNRSFPTRFVSYTSNRNYNAGRALAAREAAALAQFVRSVKGSAVNICIDTHGWLSQIITSNGTNNSLYSIFKNKFPGNSYANCNLGAGYFTAYTAALGYTSCLFEFPGGLYSLASFQKSGYCERYCSCILELMRAYGTYAPRAQYTITATAQGSGTVTGGGTFYVGDTVTLTATAGENAAFTGWYDANGTLLSASRIYTFTVTASSAITARFKACYTITATSTGPGTVSGGGTYLEGDTVTLTATPTPGANAAFAGWYDSAGTLLTINTTCTFTAAADSEIFARFVTVYTVTAQASRSGSVRGSGTYLAGEPVTLVAEPREGHTLEGWYNSWGSLLGSQTTCTLTPTANMTVYALFSGDLFVDVADDWYTDTVMEAAQKGYVTGTNGVLFSPSRSITRAELVTLVTRLAGVSDDDLAKAPAGNPFTDCQNAWYTPYVSWAYSAGIVTGRSETEFDPASPITRQEAAAIFVRYLTYANAPAPFGTADFLDAADISGWAEDSVGRAQAAGLILGAPEGDGFAFNPLRNITRAEAVTILMRAEAYIQTYEPLPDSLLDFTEAETIPVWVDGVELSGLLLEDTPLVLAADLKDQWPDFRHVTMQESLKDGSTVSYFLVTNFDDPLEGYSGGQGIYFPGQTEEYWLPVTQTVPTWASLWDAEQQTAYLTNPNTGNVTGMGTKLPVLMYHEISDDTWGLEYLCVSPENMRTQLQYLKDHDYDPIFFSDLSHLEDYDKPILLTFDDGYSSNYEPLYPLLQEFDVKATFFVTTEYLNKPNHLTTEQLQEMRDSGLVDIQSHTADHIKLDELTPREQEYQMYRSRLEIARITRHIPYALAYPEGSYNSDTLELAANYYRFAVRSGGGPWYVNDRRFEITRSIVARATTMESFIAMVS